MTHEEGKIRYAVIGAGNIAQVAILPAFAHAKENSELVAIITDDAEKQEQLGRRYDLQHCGGYEQFERIAAEALVDAVYIATPNSRHREFTERAARVGLHVLCEKPIAPTVADSEAMIQIMRQNRLKLMVAYRLHFEPGTLAAAQLVQDGTLGKPKVFSAVFSHQVRPGDIRTQAQLGGGGMLDLGVYPINAARSLFRDEPVEVCALCPPDVDARFDGVDETVSAILRFPRGELAQLTISQGASSVSSYRVVGTKGDLRVEPAFEYVDGIKHYLTLSEDSKTREKQFPKGDQFAPELVYFSRCILEGTEPEPSGEEGLADVRVVTAVLESMKTGKTVRLAPFTSPRHPSKEQAMHKPPVKEPKTVHAPSPSFKG